MSDVPTDTGSSSSNSGRSFGTPATLVAAIVIALAGAVVIQAAKHRSEVNSAIAAAKASAEIDAKTNEDVGKAAADQPGESAASGDKSSKEPPEKTPADSGDKPNPEESTVEYPFQHRLDVPDNIFDGGRDWLNTSGDIRMKDLRGKIVILDFWTYCCINCMHVLPDLAFIEQKYPKEVVVIGVHSAKFDNEKETENIRRAVQRYNIEHPVVNDADMLIWRKFGINAWPTLLIIDAEGRACFATSGEGKKEILDLAVSKLIEYHKATKTLDETPLRFDLEREKMPPTPLKFPGKIIADEAGGRLFIADTNHNRIVVCSLDGTLQEVIGSGAIGAKDGSYEAASFDHPQGMALSGDTLYVADTENHLLRTVDLKEKKVATLAGTGEQDRQRTPGGPLLQTPLNSPWDVLIHNGTLFIGMAGPHQIWSHKLGSDELGAYAGSGREDVRNGTLEESAFAQPSGLATDGKSLFVVDSEGSSIRRVPLDGKGEVTTVAGTHDLPRGQSLFAFGDVDGPGNEARFQHPIGIAYHDGALYVTDSYNHKIKRIILGEEKSDVATWLGDLKPGTSVDPPRFNEPHGAAVAAGKLFIADTNNHRICVADLKTGAMTELAIAGLTPPKPKKSDSDDVLPGKPIAEVPLQKVAAGKTLAFAVRVKLPEGYKVNQQGTVSAKLTAKGEQDLVASEHLDKRQKAELADDVATLSVPLSANAGKATYELALTYTYCRDGSGGVCKLATSRWKIPVELSAKASEKPIELDAVVE